MDETIEMKPSVGFNNSMITSTENTEEAGIAQSVNHVDPYCKSERIRMIPNKDGLNYQLYADSLSDLLYDPNTETPLTVGIYGNWGQGKTSLLELTDQSISEKHKNLEDQDAGSVKYKVRLAQHNDGCCNVHLTFWTSMLLQFLLPFLLFLLCLGVIIFIFVTRGHFVTPQPDTLSTASTVVSQYVNQNVSTGTYFPQEPRFYNIKAQENTPTNKVAFWWIFVALGGFCLIWIPCCFCAEHASVYTALEKWLMICYFYPTNPEPLNKRIELISVKFNAMEYAACDDLWIGIMTNLCDQLEDRFGKYRSRLYRSIRKQFMQKMNSIQNKTPETEIFVKDPRSQKNESIFLIPYYSCGCLPKFMFQVVIGLFLLLAVVTILLAICYGYFNVTVTWIASVGAVTGLVTLALAAIKFMFYICKSLKSYINSLVTKSSVMALERGQGLMHCVKDEVRLLEGMIQFMQWVEQREFRIILYVDDLDRCDKEKCLKLLHAINIILSEPDTPFVSLIAVDPRVMARVIEDPSALKVEQTRVNGHEYLKKFIHLPLALPEIPERYIQRLIYKYKVPSSDTTDFTNTDGNLRFDKKIRPYEEALTILRDAPSHISRNPRTVKRLCNILNLVMRLRYNQKNCIKKSCAKETGALTEIEKLTWWIVLAELWPYRLSMLVYLLRNNKNKKDTKILQDCDTLQEVYQSNMHILKTPHDWKSLITLDLEETNFCEIIQKQELTVSGATDFLPYTINLDFSLSETFALAMGQNKIESLVIYKL